MPLHGYTTDRRPPTNTDHLLAHPYSIFICGWQILAGAAVVASILLNFALSRSLSRLPESLLAVIAAMLIVGGVSVIRGLLDDSDDLMVGWRIERTGLVLSATAWAAYAVTIIAAFPASVLTWTSALTFTGAHLVRLRATRLEEKRVRARIAEQTRP
jgi:hypothetical protein